MKQYSAFLLSALLGLQAFAQEEMPTVWTTRLEHKIQYTGTDVVGMLGYSYAASDKEMTVFDNTTGKTLWTKPFKQLAPNLRKIDELVPFWESNCVFLFDRKLGKDQIGVIDLKTGQALWTSEKYQDLTEDNIMYIKERDGFAISTKAMLSFVKARTGEEVWSTSKFKGVVGKYVFMPDGNVVMVNFIPDGLGALFSGFKNQLMKVNLDNGDIAWEATFVGRAERKVLTGEFLYDLSVDGDRVYLRLNGMQVYDYKTGQQLWNAAFDFTPDRVVGRPAGAKKWGVYGAVAEPVVVGDDLYVLDCQNRKSQYIKKYDRKSGKLLWTSREIPEAKAIPGMYVVDDRVILQIGGQVETQAYIVRTQRNADGSTTTVTEKRIAYENVKPCGVKGFSTTDGSMVWESERFKKGITNAFAEGNRLYVCSGKALYSMDYKTGKDGYEIPLGDDNIGNAEMIMPYKDKVAVMGEKGVATHNMADGKLVNSGKYKSSHFHAREGDFVLMQTDGADIAAFDLNTCKFLQFNARRDSVSELSSDGDYVYVFEKKDVTKVKTH
ncbi:MAG: PQQ-binding-like beta-propeller repeat protein [Flavobacteriales bacterium]